MSDFHRSSLKMASSLKESCVGCGTQYSLNYSKATVKELRRCYIRKLTIICFNEAEYDVN